MSPKHASAPIIAEPIDITGISNHIAGVQLGSTYVTFFINDGDPKIYLNIVDSDDVVATIDQEWLTITSLFDGGYELTIKQSLAELLG